VGEDDRGQRHRQARELDFDPSNEADDDISKSIQSRETLHGGFKELMAMKSVLGISA
jgi:hypothetical protein